MATLTDRQIEMVRSSWTALKPQAVRLTDVLYEELFSAEPQLRILFEGPMDEQHRKLAEAITLAVDQLDDQPSLQKTLRELGERHETYGVRPYHYEAIEAAFDRTLERLMGDDLDRGTREAWKAFVHLVTSTMQGKG